MSTKTVLWNPKKLEDFTENTMVEFNPPIPANCFMMNRGKIADLAVKKNIKSAKLIEKKMNGKTFLKFWKQEKSGKGFIFQISVG